jgi:hypothetical protein
VDLAGAAVDDEAVRLAQEVEGRDPDRQHDVLEARLEELDLHPLDHLLVAADIVPDVLRDRSRIACCASAKAGRAGSW